VFGPEEPSPDEPYPGDEPEPVGKLPGRCAVELGKLAVVKS